MCVDDSLAAWQWLMTTDAEGLIHDRWIEYRLADACVNGDYSRNVTTMLVVLLEWTV